MVKSMNKRSYYVTKDKKKKETTLLELDKLDGYNVNPKVKEKDGIQVSKIVFVNPDFSEKIIRKKIDYKIKYLLEQLKIINDGDSDGEDQLKRDLMAAEKLRIQIINNYVKYLGHTYESLTLNKLGIIIKELRYRLYIIDERKRNEYYRNTQESKRGR